jgi:gluconolactonase
MPIEQADPALERIVAQGQEVEWLGSGYGGGAVAEGPLWWKEGGYLLFSDIGNSQRLKWAPGEGVSVFYEPTNNANGLTRDNKGRLIACEHGTRRVSRLEPDGSITVVAGSYQGRRLNRPNDVVVKSGGSIYFTDPGAPDPALDLDYSGVYLVSPDLGTLTLLVRDFVTPNGLAFSPDESVLYVNDSRRGHIRAFDVQPNGTLALATDRVFRDLRGERPGVPDGMKVDVEGNVYCGGSGGIWVMDATGLHLGTIAHGAPATTNLAWGGDDWKTIYFTTRDSLGRIQLKIAGLPVPSK